MRNERNERERGNERERDGGGEKMRGWKERERERGVCTNKERSCARKQEV